MPIPLADSAWDEWLDGPQSDPKMLLMLLHSGPGETFEAWPISRAVNAPKNQGSKLIERM
jgi:putative SOS response-associated peptidase YedK